MYEFELHRFRSADLRRTAQQERLAREVARAGRAARRAARLAEAAHNGGPDAEPHTGRRGRRSRLPRTA
ncbi:hypothetical protein OIB37_25710 [Streptomyces sp. NBC_00820]|uniref:hypothetical protein n=1 Tax=Streptomyces sp. NBC_00820 TaxID=2975842 RepID=UPI002ED14CB8|nr:hypothetical protein OIB37_25710 [Streptomyces sp. NBC_00820]